MDKFSGQGKKVGGNGEAQPLTPAASVGLCNQREKKNIVESQDFGRRRRRQREGVGVWGETELGVLHGGVKINIITKRKEADLNSDVNHKF